MADEIPKPAAHAGVPAPVPPPQGDQEIRKPDLQMFVQNVATLNQTLSGELRLAAGRLKDERERSRYEQDRIRMELGEKIKDREMEIEVLVRTLGRAQAENARIREALAVARAEKANNHPAAVPETPRKEGPAAPIHIPLGSKFQGFSPQEPILGGIPVKLVEPHVPQRTQGAP